MGGIQITSKGSFEKATAYLERLKMLKITRILEAAGQRGVDALRGASPRDTGIMADSWFYEITYTGNGMAKLEWHNSDIEGGANGEGYNVALLVQYGHGTNHGGYVPPHDYINPALAPIFEEISRQIGEEVKRV